MDRMAALNELQSRLPQDKGDGQDDDMMKDEDLVTGSAKEDEMKSMMEQYMKDVQNALDAVQEGKTKRAASILQGILKQHSDSSSGAVDMESDMQHTPAKSY